MYHRRMTALPSADREVRFVELLEALNIYSDLRLGVLVALDDDTVDHERAVLAEKGFNRRSGGATTRRVLDAAAEHLNHSGFDREYRDDAFPRLIEVGMVEKAYAVTKTSDGHGVGITRGLHKSKSNNNMYVLTEELLALMDAAPAAWNEAAHEWLARDNERRRKAVERSAAVANASASGTSAHSTLIATCVDTLLASAAAGFTPIFVDDDDGDRIRDEYREQLEPRGLMPDLSSKWPDAILVEDKSRSVWFVDAVTGDGEIDQSRGDALVNWAGTSNWTTVGMTTAYLTWKAAGARQNNQRNLAVDSSMWIADDGGKLFVVRGLIPKTI